MKLSNCQHLFHYFAVIVACMATASGAFGWTSSGAPFFEAVHQTTIDNVLKNLVDSANLKILKDQQVAVDKRQQPVQSDEHSMTGIMMRGDTLAIQKPIFIKRTENLIRENLLEAIRQKKTGALSAAFSVLGNAIHTLQDASSPTHEGFQPWSFEETLWSKKKHIDKECVYPVNQSLYRTRLEGSVQWAYDIYSEKIKMPDQFFDSQGMLQLPQVYGTQLGSEK